MDLGCWFEKEDCGGSKRDYSTQSVLRLNCSPPYGTTSIYRGFPPCSARCQHIYMIPRKPPL
jgi:hypothetical protein